MIFGDESGAADMQVATGQVHLDKMWHGVHWLLTGTVDSADGLGAAPMGGREVGDDLGYDPAQVLEPDEVQRVSRAMAAVSESELVSRFDAAAMNHADVYPAIWDEPEILDKEVLPALRAVIKLYERAAAANDGVLVAMT